MSEPTVLEPPAGDHAPVPPGAPPQPAAQPARVGRYVILRKLGEGAMGEVYVAYDEQLDRRVAVKLVRAMGQGAVDVYSRMLREAQGLARLSHPNVVQVYEAGEFDGRVYLAMEYIEGEPLRAWASAAPRTWRELLRCCVEAGRGLAAAHRVGLVHRDFKPDNVIVGDDGRVRVLDFGLVRADQETPARDAVLRGTEDPMSSGALVMTSGSTSLNSELTQAHTLIGTPAYMSPEQHLRQVADARADIFAFCVVLYELLYGARPFAGRDQAAIMRAVLAQELSPPREGRRIPLWLRRVILRGLRVDPDARWPTIDRLLTAIDAGAARRRRLAWVGLTALLGVAAVSAGTYAIRADATACSGGDAAIAAVWDPPRRAALAAAFTASGVPYAATAQARVEEHLDRFARAWVASYGEACRAHRRGENSAELLDLRMACLRDRQREVDAALHALLRADAAAVERAVPAISSLTDLRALALCDDPQHLQRGHLGRAAIDPARAAALEELRGKIADAAALAPLGRGDEGLAALATLAPAIDAAGEPSLEIDADLARGRLLLIRGSYTEAGAALQRAYYAARALGYDDAAAAATIELLRHLTVTQASAEVSDHWSRLATAEVALVDRADRLADAHAAQAGLYMTQGSYEEALVAYERALELRRRDLAPGHPAIAEALRGIGAAHFKRGRNAEARARFEEALAATGAALGPEHPVNTQIFVSLAMIAAREGRTDAAVAAATEALAISEGARGPEHPQNADILFTLGEFEIVRGNFGAAAEALDRAVTLATATYGADHPKIAAFFGSLGVARYKLGDLDRGQALIEEALARSEANLGASHPHTATFRANLGEIDNDRGRYAAAKERLEPALAALAAAYGADRPELGPTHRELARALLGLGDLDASEREARRALGLVEAGSNIAADEVAKTRLILARILRARDPEADPAPDPEAEREAAALVAAAHRDLNAQDPATPAPQAE